jgi:uncharacterized protein (DUF4415 family)
MATSGTLTPERIAEIRAFPQQYDSDCPPVTKEMFAQGHFRNPETARRAAAKMQASKPVEINLDHDVSAWLEAKGKDYSLIINQILREAIRFGQMTA